MKKETIYLVEAGGYEDKQPDCYFTNREDADRYIACTNNNLEDEYWERSVAVVEVGELTEEQRSLELLYIYRISFYPKHITHAIDGAMTLLEEITPVYSVTVDPSKKGFRGILVPNERYSTPVDKHYYWVLFDIEAKSEDEAIKIATPYVQEFVEYMKKDSIGVVQAVQYIKEKMSLDRKGA